MSRTNNTKGIALDKEFHLRILQRGVDSIQRGIDAKLKTVAGLRAKLAQAEYCLSILQVELKDARGLLDLVECPPLKSLDASDWKSIDDEVASLNVVQRARMVQRHFRNAGIDLNIVDAKMIADGRKAIRDANTKTTPMSIDGIDVEVEDLTVN